MGGSANGAAECTSISCRTHFLGGGRARGLCFCAHTEFPCAASVGDHGSRPGYCPVGIFHVAQSQYQATKIPRILAMVTAMGATGASLIALGERGFGLLVLLSAAVAAIGQWVVYEN